MKQFLLVLIALLGLSIPAFAQQDPDDQGIQDSLIIGEVSVDSGQTFAFVPVYAVSDDSVFFYNVPIRWTAPGGGVYASSGNIYFSPLTSWDNIFDMAMVSQNYQREFGFNDLSLREIPPLFTNGLRLHVWSIRFVISPIAPSQLVVLDTTWDDRNYSIVLGLFDGRSEITPGVQRGYISIGGAGTEKETRPSAFSLSQNYPNPFNSSTEIEFSLPQSRPVSLVIYDIQGREIRRLFDSNTRAGSQKIVWNGTDNNNVDVASGIYFYRLISGENAKINRMTLLR